MQLRDPDGKVLKKVQLQNAHGFRDYSSHYSATDNQERICIVALGKEIMLLNGDLETKESASIMLVDVLPAVFSDLDQDGSPELLVAGNKPGEYFIFRKNLDHPVSFIAEASNQPCVLSNIVSSDKPAKIGMQVNQHFSFLNMRSIPCTTGVIPSTY